MQTADAYRKTFEEQLNQNTTLMLSIEMMRKDVTFNSSSVKSNKNRKDGRKHSYSDENYGNSYKNTGRKNSLDEANLMVSKLQELVCIILFTVQ